MNSITSSKIGNFDVRIRRDQLFYNAVQPKENGWLSRFSIIICCALTFNWHSFERKPLGACVIKHQMSNWLCYERLTRCNSLCNVPSTSVYCVVPDV